MNAGRCQNDIVSGAEKLSWILFNVMSVSIQCSFENFVFLSLTLIVAFCRRQKPLLRLPFSASTRNTAITEISEETGLPKKNLHILKKLVPTHYHKNINGKTVVKKTIWYAVEFRGDFSTPLIPDTNENITECKWFQLDELVLVLEESHERIRYLIEFFLNMPFYKKYKKKI